jgi:hypothetical protein
MLGRMTTPEQFLESFLQERAAAYAEANVRLLPVHAKYFGEPLSKHSGDFLMRDRVQTVFEDVKQSVESAIVITREPMKRNAVERKRYHLSAVGEGWKIIRIDWQCFLCGGTGRSGDDACQTCDGDGWYDPRKMRPSN